MDIRRAKQVIYGSFYLLIVIGLSLGFYFSFIHAPASCFDGIQNQQETGVDCGGPCQEICIPANLEKITNLGGVSIFDAYPLSSALPRHYSVLAQVANVNAGFAASDFKYTFTLYGASSTVIGTIPGESFLYGGEVKYLVAPNVVTNAPVERATLKIESPTWVASAVLGLTPDLAVQGIAEGPQSSSTITVDATLTDRDIAAFSDVLIIAVFYSRSNTPIGASQTVVDKIAPQETVPFSVTYPANAGVDPARTKIFAYALRR